MNRALVDRIARSVLYEGYILYPYRPSALKNAQRWTFGTLYPPSWVEQHGGSDRSEFQAEVLFAGAGSATVTLIVRYLAQDVESEVITETAVTQARRKTFHISELAFDAVELRPDLYKLRVVVRNTAEWARVGGTAATGQMFGSYNESGRGGAGPQATTHESDIVAQQSMISAHAVISVSEGELISMTDPPPELAENASQCVNKGVWPVLIGERGAKDSMLAAPIILPDYPEVAPESAGDLCDATEIEEILTLRILTLTDEEKAEVRASEDRARRILERAEALPAEHLMKLHGTIRGLAPSGSEPWSAWDNWANRPAPETIRVNGAELRAGDRVRLRPVKRADIFDTALAGRVAVIAGIEQDFENKVQVAVVVEDDPGRDLGEMRQTAHRFFFSPEEIELP